MRAEPADTADKNASIDPVKADNEQHTDRERTADPRAAPRLTAAIGSGYAGYYRVGATADNLAWHGPAAGLDRSQLRLQRRLQASRRQRLPRIPDTRSKPRLHCLLPRHLPTRRRQHLQLAGECSPAVVATKYLQSFCLRRSCDQASQVAR